MKKIIDVALFFVLSGSLFSLDNQRWFELELFPTLVVSLGDGQNIDSITQTNYLQHNKFFAAEIDLQGGGFEFFLALNIFQSLVGYSSNAGWSNLPYFIPGAFDINNYFTDTPAEGFLEYASDLFDISVGRRRWALGYGEFNMGLGQQAPYYDGGWFSLHPPLADGVRRWHYDFLFAGDEHKLTRELIEKNEVALPVLATMFSDMRWLQVHKLGYQGKTWQIGVAEILVIAEIEPGVMSLMPIWHQLSSSSLNDNIDVSFEKRFDHVRLYGDIYMDDFTLPHEVGKGNPNAWGLYFGADFRLADTAPFSGVFHRNDESLKSENSFAFTDGAVFSVQAAFASRYLYWRNEGHPFAKMVMFRRTQGGIIESVIGFPYGNDCFMLKASTDWSSSRWLLRGGLALLFLGYDNIVKYYTGNDYALSGLLVGEQVAGTVKSDPNWVFSGIDSINLVFDPEVYYALTRNISLYAGLNLRLIANRINHSTVAFSLGAFMNF
jgi:hypothetical protein